jgi:hypothetical protein
MIEIAGFDDKGIPFANQQTDFAARVEAIPLQMDMASPKMMIGLNAKIECLAPAGGKFNCIVESGQSDVKTPAEKCMTTSKITGIDEIQKFDAIHEDCAIVYGNATPSRVDKFMELFDVSNGRIEIRVDDVEGKKKLSVECKKPVAVSSPRRSRHW